MDDATLPSGKHWGLDIDTAGMIHTGMYIQASPKLIWHTTEGEGLDAMVHVLRGEAAQPHVVIDPHSGHVKQLIPLDHYARALQHPQGTPETNRAHCIQVEICGFAKDSATWPHAYYEHLGALAVLLEHRQHIARVANHPFADRSHVRRLSPEEFISATGHLGHQHAPSQPAGHWDPGTLDVNKLFSCMKDAEQRFQ